MSCAPPWLALDPPISKGGETCRRLIILAVSKLSQCTRKEPFMCDGGLKCSIFTSDYTYKKFYSIF
jgi:hypothetical protein